MKKALYFGIAALSIALAVATYSLLFRESTFGAGDAVVTLRWRWGRAREMLIDWNHDGVVDQRNLYRRWSTEFWSHDKLDEAFIDSDGDGWFELYVKLENHGVSRVEHDVDGDGVREVVVSGDPEAPDYFRSLTLPQERSGRTGDVSR